MPSWSSSRVPRLTESGAKLVATSDVADALGADARVEPMRWQRYGGRRAFHGVIATVRCLGAAGLVRQCVESHGEGRVLIVDAGGQLSAAVLGDRMAGNALRNGWAGIVVHGAVRDVDALSMMEIGVFALRATPNRGSFELDGEVDVPLTLGGFQLNPGEYVFCDGDGIVVCSGAAAKRVLA